MLVPLLLCLAAVVIVLLVIAALRPAAYRVERSLAIDAPADRVFGVLDDLRQFSGALVFFGSTWDQADPELEKTFTGPARGVGQRYAWRSKKVGEGTLTIDASEPDQRVAMTLRFEKPMASVATIELTIAGPRVTWVMAGSHNFIGRFFGLFMNLDKMLGADLDKGLAQLQAATRS